MIEMGCKAEGAAQGYTVLGGIILGIIALQMLADGLNTTLLGDINGLVDVVIAIVLIVMVLLSFDACGFIDWKVPKSGLLLAIFGLVSMFIVAGGLTFYILTWFTNIGLLAGFMILLAGLLLILHK